MTTGPVVANGGRAWIQAWGPILVFLLTQAVVGVVWLARLQDASDDLSRHASGIDARISAMDEHGTRHLDVVIDRQQNILSRLAEIENRMRLLEQSQLPHK